MGSSNRMGETSPQLYYNLNWISNGSTLSDKPIMFKYDGIQVTQTVTTEIHGVALNNMRVFAEVKNYFGFNTQHVTRFQEMVDGIKNRYEARYEANLAKRFILVRLAIRVFNFIRGVFGFGPKPEMNRLYDVVSMKLADAKVNAEAKRRKAQNMQNQKARAAEAVAKADQEVSVEKKVLTSKKSVLNDLASVFGLMSNSEEIERRIEEWKRNESVGDADAQSKTSLPRSKLDNKTRLQLRQKNFAKVNSTDIMVDDSTKGVVETVTNTAFKVGQTVFTTAMNWLPRALPFSG